MTDPRSPTGHPPTDTPGGGRPSIAEVAAPTARPPALSNAGRDADPNESDRSLADKRDLLALITADDEDVTAAADDVGTPADEPDREPGWYPQAEAASWAVAARDAAIEKADWTAADRFAAEARDAIAAALAAGADRDALAAELDYPGGAAELDGPHIDALLDQHRLDDAAIRATPGDGADRTYSPAEAAEALTAHGVAADAAAAVVERYLSDLTERCGWEPGYGWEIDGDDLAVMLDPPPPVGAGLVELALAAGDVPTYGPDDAELDDLHARVEAARAEGGFWLPSAAREQWRERDEPGPDGRRWELRDVAGEPSAVADAYGSTYGTGYDWWAREHDPTAEHGMSGAEGAPIPAGPVLSAEAAAHALAARDGRPLEQARAEVSRYLDDVSELLGTSAHAWGVDDADLAALAADDTAARPLTDVDTAEAVACRPEAPAEAERRDQLTRWHAEDTAADQAAADADVPSFARGDEATP